MSRNFLIVAPSYDENVGGIVVLHKLCHLLNERGVTSYILPYEDNYLLNSGNILGSIYAIFKQYIKLRFTRYKLNAEFNTPLLTKVPVDIDDPSWVVIYPEVINGNPLNAKRIVRWFLHQPGFHSGNIFFGPGELHVKYNSAIYDFQFPDCTLAIDHLKIIHYPTNFYNQTDVLMQRKGTAYCLRKGKDKELVHDLMDSVLIDGKSHAEIAKIFKSVDRFISYDTLTAYSRFAALCGCTSIVVPDSGVSIDDWYPNDKDRCGISYGFNHESILEANATRHLVSSQIQDEELQCSNDITRFLKNVDNHFKG